jgi:uncharacterized membrane protein YphA (DoxX/SURF4 family)
MTSFTTKPTSGNLCIAIGLLLFAITWIGTGTQHIMYADFVATLVPQFMPVKIFWVWLTGVGMLLAGVSFLIRYKVTVAALMLSVMLGFFIVLIHLLRLSSTTTNWMYWFRFIQDVAIMGACLLLANNAGLVKAGRCLYAGGVLVLGIAHFYHPALISPKVPAYFPAIAVFDYTIGTILILLSAAILFKFYAGRAALILAILLLTFALLYSAPPLVKNIKDAGQWTTLLLDLALAAGALFVAGKLSDD